MTKTYLLPAGFGACLLLISCEPIPTGPVPRYQGPPDPGAYHSPDGRYGPGDEFPTEPMPAPAPQPRRDQYPMAERTANPNQVLSPYPPYNVIDVEGFRTGQLAKDPSNGKIFRVP